MANKLTEFLENIREIDGFKNAILCGITVSKKERVAEFALVTDKTYNAAEEARVKGICDEYLPDGISAAVKVTKRVPDAEILKKQIFLYIQKNFL